MTLRTRLSRALHRLALRLLAASLALLALGGTATAADNLLLKDVGNPTVVGTSQGKRAIWADAGTVGGVGVDLVATLDRATLNHDFITNNARAAVRSVGPEDIHTTWRLFASGSGYDINADSGGTPVTADIHVQLNDIDGPSNEKAYIPLCNGTVSWVRIDKSATTGRDLGTVAGQPDTFILIGDKNYNAEPVSGLEALYPNASSFAFGRTAANIYYVRVDRPSYGAGQTIDFQCVDFKLPPVAVDDTPTLGAGASTSFDIVANDALATGYPSGPTEWFRNSVSLVPPSNASGITTSYGRNTGFTTAEGTWRYDPDTGALAFTPAANLGHSPAPVQYRLENASRPDSTQPSYSAPATVQVTGVIDAADETLPPVDGLAATANAGNVLANDKVSGRAADPAFFTTQVVAPASHPGVGLAANGTVTVAADTPAGTYTIGYKTCEAALPLNCDTASVSITVTRKAIVAGADGPYRVGGAAGAASVGNAFDNDTLDGARISSAAVTVSETANNSNGKVTLDTATGEVSVAAATPAGSYAIGYRICEKPGTVNCAAATIAVEVDPAPITAADDTPAAINGRSGGTVPASAFANDTLDGTTVDAADILASELSNTSNGKITFDPATGQVTAAAATPAGSYTVTYRICERLNPANCDEASIIVPISAAPLLANADQPASPVNGASGTANALNALANDTLDGSAVNRADITLTRVSRTNAKVDIDTSTGANAGAVSIAPGTPAGSYAIVYRICEVLNAANCASATVTVEVARAPILARDDTPAAINGRSGGTVPASAFANDELNGVAVDPTAIAARVVSNNSNGNITFDTQNGVVTVGPNTPAGPYAIAYEICETLNSGNCSNAEVRLQVTAATITASNDPTPSAVDGFAGKPNVINVLANDTLNGAAADPNDVTLSETTGTAHPGVTLDIATGVVSVAPRTRAGQYTLTYTVCEKLNASNCANASVTFTVDPAPLQANADSAGSSVNGRRGEPQVLNVLANDSIAGAQPAPADVTISVLQAASNLKVGLDVVTGIVKVDAGTKAGTYTIGYRITDKSNPDTRRSDATVTVVVVAAPLVVGSRTTASVGGANGEPRAAQVFDDARIDGLSGSAAELSVSVIQGASHPGVTLDTATGIVSVAAGTPKGDYAIIYKICENLNADTNCKTATITIPVTGGTISAANDATGPIAGAAGSPRAIDVLANDKLNGADATLAKVALKVVAPAANPGVTLDTATGTVSVAAGTPADTYEITYQICERINPATVCDDATVSVQVAPGTIVAQDDRPQTVSGRAGNAVLANVFGNDTLDGAPLDPNAVTARVTVPAQGGRVTLNTATGAVSVAAGTPTGVYTIGYEICETLNPRNCAASTISVEITAAAVTAADDGPFAVGGVAGAAKLANAFKNDSLDGLAIDPAAIIASVTQPAAVAGVRLDTATGIVSVAAGTPEGSYEIGYRICERINGDNCSDAVITVAVGAGTLKAANDKLAAVNGTAGKAAAGNVLGNDRLNGAKAPGGAVTLAVATPAADPGVTLDPATGTVSVAAGTPAGTYTITYRLCEAINPGNCADATVTVPVKAARLAANDDRLPVVDGSAGKPDAGRAFGNDRLNGSRPPAGTFKAEVTAPAADPGVTMDVGTGLVSVAAGTRAGLYMIGYRICETVNPANCDEAVVSLRVEAGAILAADDASGTPFDTKDAITRAVDLLVNDRVGTAPARPATVTVAATTKLPKGFSLSPEGIVGIAQGTASGDYRFDYRICEVLNPENCDTATATLPVRKSVPAVSGTVFMDADGDGVFDRLEKRLGGYRVELRRAGKLVQATVSAADGTYGFVDFPLADGYTVVFVDPETNTSVGALPGLNFAGGQVRTGQDQAVEPDGVVYGVATGKPLAGAKLQLQTAKGSPLPETCLLPRQQNQVTGADGLYRFDILFGMAAACPATPADYRIAVVGFPAGTEPGISTVAPPLAGTLDAATCLVDAVRGGACQLSASTDAPPAGSPAPYVLAFRSGAEDPPVVNNHIPLDPAAALPSTGLTITKRATVSVVRRDEAVVYVITASNENGRAAGPLEIRDRLPAGFRLVEKSAKVNGAAFEPKVSGRTLVFAGLKVPAKGSVQVTLVVRVGADVAPGEHANEAWAAQANGGAALTGIAKATVRVLAEHVFDCGEVIGKVFDDRDRDGAQGEGEKGLPGVRVVTYEGFLITTDAHGRFSVPCAALPDPEIGSNYVLKLDTRTLPDGYAPTTKNPRTVRLTAGKVSKVNFGATAGRAVAVELSARAFSPDGAEPTAELRDGLLGLKRLSGEKGARLAVTYRAGGEPDALVKARLKRVRALLGNVWRSGGKTLPVEFRVVGGE